MYLCRSLKLRVILQIPHCDNPSIHRWPHHHLTSREIVVKCLPTHKRTAFLCDFSILCVNALKLLSDGDLNRHFVWPWTTYSDTYYIAYLNLYIYLHTFVCKGTKLSFSENHITYLILSRYIFLARMTSSNVSTLLRLHQYISRVRSYFILRWVLNVGWMSITTHYKTSCKT